MRGAPGRFGTRASAAAEDEPRGLAHGRHRDGRVPRRGQPEAARGLGK